MPDVADCLRQLTTMTWMEVLQTASKGEGKAGLAYTPYDDSELRGVMRPIAISRDVRIAGVRITKKGRLFGFYIDHTFYVLWFDEGHKIVPA